MTDDKVKRRLTTVLCADVHGYSRLMEADEAGTLATLRRYRTAIAGLVERHDGRIVNTWGDAVIAEFASVVEAVQCAVEILAGNFQRGVGPTSRAPHAVSHRRQSGRRDGGRLRHLWRRGQHRGAAAGTGRAWRRRDLRARLRSGAQQIVPWLRLSRPATDEERCSRDQLSSGHERSKPSGEAATTSTNDPLPGGSRRSLERWRFNGFGDETRAVHVNARPSLIGSRTAAIAPRQCSSPLQAFWLSSMLSPVFTGSGSIGQSQHCSSLPSYRQCTGANPRRTEKRSAERIASERPTTLVCRFCPREDERANRLRGLC